MPLYPQLVSSKMMEQNLRDALEDAQSLMFETGKPTDMIIMCGEKEISCHRAILAYRSQFFAKICNNSPEESIFRSSVSRTTHRNKEEQPFVATIDEEPKWALEALMNHLYTREMPPLDEYAHSFDKSLTLFKLGDKYGIPHFESEGFRCLKILCVRRLELNDWAVIQSGDDDDYSPSLGGYIEGFQQIWKIHGTYGRVAELRSTILSAMVNKSYELVQRKDFEEWLRQDIDFNIAFLKAVCKVESLDEAEDGACRDKSWEMI